MTDIHPDTDTWSDLASEATMERNTPYLVDGLYNAPDLIDLESLHTILDEFSALTELNSSLVSHPDQETLASSGGRALCDLFHQSSENAAASCRASRLLRVSQPASPQPSKYPPCAVGLVSAATPVIIKNTHIANLFAGQVLLQPPDRQWYEALADRYGYDRDVVLATLDEVPVISKPQLDQAAAFLRSIALLIAQQGLAKLRLQENARSLAAEIEQRKQAEQQRRHLEEQVRHAQKLESLGVLAGGIAHDFNNLLMVILGNAALALDGLPANAPHREPITEIEKASRRAADLCGQMLAYSGKGAFRIELTDLSELVEEMAHMLEISISKKAALRYEFGRGLPAIAVDATQVRQVVLNLITNASEAIGERDGVIAIKTRVVECDHEDLAGSYLNESLSAGTYVCLEVKDTGQGMDRVTRQRLFDPFFSTKFAGRGLGMAAVIGIIRGHEGAIKVRSEPGIGTTIQALFPAAARPDRSLEATSISDDVCDGGTTGTVLLVDDEAAVRRVGARMLETLGYVVVTASDGIEALSALTAARDEIVCVLLDLTMPHLDGEETCRELRNIRADIPVIVSSGYNAQDVTQRFAGLNQVEFIQKPYSIAALGSVLREMLGGVGDGVDPTAG